MKLLFIFSLIFTTQAIASQFDQELFNLKEAYSEKAYVLKIQQENEQNTFSEKINLKSLAMDDECVEFVYRGPSSREESVAACRGVVSMACVEFVYRGPASRLEAVQACRGVVDMDCVEFVYRGSASRVEAAQSCGRSNPRPRCQ